MWRDIDSLRKQNESTKKEIESMRSKSKQTEIETEQLRSKSKQIEIETEQLRSETEILKRQNKALELIESSDLNALLREATITGKNDSGQSEDQLDLDLLAEKFVALGCDADDVPFLFDVLELIKGKELSPLRPMPEELSQAKKITTHYKVRPGQKLPSRQSRHVSINLEDAFMEREFKLSEFAEQDNSSQLPIGRQQQHRSLPEHAYRNTSDLMVILQCLGPEGFFLERVVFPSEMLNFSCPKDSEVKIWTHGLYGPELLEIIRAEELLIREPDANPEQVGFSRFKSG
jgi:hypothetical protein